MSGEINTIKSFFTSIQVHLTDCWLESCIDWCKTEILPQTYSPKDLQGKVYEQWLLLDLRDISVATLPPNLSTKQHYTLTGNFCLQMMQMMDISKPKLWQLQKIRNSNALTKGTQHDSEVVGTGKRVLQMTLTDGVQEIEAMEYKPVSCLSINLAPGTKVRVMGPVVIRRGRLMLEQQNVKILGGEVQELLVSHAAENVLARGLKLPENPNPGVIPEKLLAVEKEEVNEGYVNNFPIKPPEKREIKITEEEELMMCQEMDMVMEAERRKTPDLFTEDFENINRSSTSTQVQKIQNLSMSLDDEDDDIFNEIDIDAHLDRTETLKPNIITIARLLDIAKNASKGIFKIKAKFKSVEEKLTMSDGGYKLVIKIEDSSGEIIVRVHSDVITELAECTPDAIISLKNNVIGKNEAAIAKMVKTITKVKDKLLVLDNIISVTVEKDKLPIITKIQ